MKIRLSIALLTIFAMSVYAQDTDRKIEFPDLENFLTLKVDLHIHTVFSDGSVWPNIRIQEAVKDGLDAISLTEHLEYQPHLKDIPHPDRNRSFELATELAKPYDLLIISGAEITRRMPPGHSNALFIEDANKLLISDSLEVFQEAKRQGAFVFWNHPDWISQRADGVATMTPFHETLIDGNYLHGVEVANDVTWSEDALEIANKYGLAPIGASDIHGLIDYQFRISEGGHRPITLLFSKERSLASMKEALFAGRAIAWFDHKLIGDEEWLNKIIDASLSFTYEDYIGPSSILQVKVSNNSDATYLLKNKSEYSFQRNTDLITVEPHSEKTLYVRTLTNKNQITLDFEVMNAISGRDQHPNLNVEIKK